MPEMNGLEATQEIRKNGDGIPIIAVSAYTASEDIDACLKSKMNDYSIFLKLKK